MWLVPIDGSEPRALFNSAANESHAQFSPDGKWVSYLSDESGQFDVYLQPMPADGRKFRVTPNGGMSPKWSPDSRELFYGNQGHVFVVPITAQGIGNASSAPVIRDVVFGTPQGVIVDRIAVAPGAQRILAITPSNAPSGTPLTILLNWTELLPK